MTEAAFLKDPLAYQDDDVSAAWIRNGWRDPRFRDDVTYMLTRSLSKTGGFGLVSSMWLSRIPEALSASEAIDLYTCLRDDCQRLEFEWRDAFLRLFPSVEGALPASNDVSLLLEDLEYVVTSGDGRTLHPLLTASTHLPDVFGRLPALAETAHTHGHTLIADLIAERLSRGPHAA